MSIAQLNEGSDIRADLYSPHLSEIRSQLTNSCSTHPLVAEPCSAGTTTRTLACTVLRLDRKLHRTGDGVFLVIWLIFQLFPEITAIPAVLSRNDVHVAAPGVQISHPGTLVCMSWNLTSGTEVVDSRVFAVIRFLGHLVEPAVEKWSQRG